MAIMMKVTESTSEAFEGATRLPERPAEILYTERVVFTRHDWP